MFSFSSHSLIQKVSLFFIVLILLAFSGYFLYKNQSGSSVTTIWGAPEVVDANFSLEYGKIAYDTPYIDLTISEALDPETVNEKSITLAPAVSGSVSLQDQKTIRYTLDAPLENDAKYTLDLSGGIRTIGGKPLEGTMEFYFSTVSAIRVTNIFPSGKITNTNQNIIVTFSTPMIPLASLEVKDSLPCPLKITPEVIGQCKWLNGNTLEFIPDEPLLTANQYLLSVVPTKGLIYELTDTFTGEIITPPLRVDVPTGFNPQKGIIISLNAPVSQKELEDHVTLFASLKNTENTGSVDVVKLITIAPDTDADGNPSETRFIVKLANENFFYGNSYALKINKGLKPKYATEPLEENASFSPHAEQFLRGVKIFHRTITASGISDTEVPEPGRYYPDDFTPPSYLPFSGAVLELSFAEDITLDENLFHFESAQKETIPFTLEYVKFPNGNNDTMRIMLIPEKTLNPDTDYTLTVRKDANSSLEEDGVYTYHTAPRLALRIGEVLNNREVCLVSNLALEESVGISLSGKTLNFSPDFDWNTYYMDSELGHRCTRSDNERSYIMNVQLSPEKKYAVLLSSGVTDIYGDTLGRNYTLSFESVATQDEDKMISSSFTHFIQMIPSSLPIVVNFLSANSDTLDVTACTLSEKNYLELMRPDRNYYATIPCVKKVKKILPLTNHFWQITPNRFDIEDDIFGEKTDAHFIYIKGSVTEDANIEHLFIRSNLSLTLEKAGDRAVLLATSLDGKTVPQNLTFHGYSFMQGVGFVEAKVSAHFIAEKNLYTLDNPLPDVIFAENNEYFGVINQYQDQTSNYDFRYITGQDSMARDYLYLYTDRPLYKAGETVFYKGLLRRFMPTGYASSEAKAGKLRVRDKDWNILIETGVTIDANSNFDGSFSLPTDIPFGQYFFEFYTGEDENTEMIYTNGEFMVSDYKKPVFNVTLDTEKSDVTLGDTATLSGEALYYFGGNVPSADYTFSILSQDYYFNAEEYSRYQFGENEYYFSCLYWGMCEYSDELITTETGTLDASGKKNFSYAIPKTQSGEKIYSYSLDVKDPDTKKTVTETIQQIVHTTDAYVGISVPYWGSVSENIPVDGVVLDFNARGIAGKTVTLELWKREWKETKKEGVDGFFYNNAELTTEKESSKTVISGKNGEWSETLRSATGGEYEVRALYTGENGETFTSTSVIYIDGETNSYWQEGNNSITEMTVDNPIVNVGDTAYFTVKSPVNSGKMLITIEKDDAILMAYTRDITSTTERIEVPISEKYIPNIYVKVFLIGKNRGDTLPTYKRALSVVKVTTDSKELHVNISPEKTRYLPGEKVKLIVKVTDNSGNTVANANGSLVFVDESLLALMGNPLKNPFAFFYDMKRYLGVETYTSLLNLIEKLEVKDTSGGEKGGAGDGQKGGLAEKTRGVFRDTAFWYANFTTDANGIYTITTDALPDNLTTWAIESIVSTTKGNLIGIGTATIQTTKSVIIQENLPRFLGTDDRIVLSPVIVNHTDQAQNFTVTLSGTHFGAEVEKKTVWIGSGESVTVPFGLAIEAGDTFPQGAEITFSATAEETGDRDSVTNTLPILESVTDEATATVGKVTTSQDSLDIVTTDRENEKTLTLHYGATLLPNLVSGIHFLEYFPYACSEQQTSALMPAVIMKEASDRLGLPYDLSGEIIREYVDTTTGYEEKTIDGLLQEYRVTIRNFQNSDGGLSFWKDTKNSDFSLTISLLESWSRMNAIGYTLDDDMIQKAVAYVKAEFYKNKRPYCTIGKCEWNVTDRYRAIEAVLDVRPTDYEAYKMYKLVEDTDKTPDAQILQGRVLVKLINLKDIPESEKNTLRTEAEEIVKNLLSNRLIYLPRGAYIRGDSSVVTTANFLGLIALLGTETREKYSDTLDQMERFITSEKQTDGSFGSTLDTITVITALLDNLEKPSDLTVKLSLDNTIFTEKDITGTGKMSIFTENLTLPEAEKSTLHFEKNGSGSLYYDVDLRYHVPAKEIMSRDEGFFITREYYSYAEYTRIEKLQQAEWQKYLKGEIIYKNLLYPKEIENYLTPLDHLTVGKLVYVSNTVITGTSHTQVAFEGFIPAGTELVNPNFQTESVSVTGEKNSSIFSHVEWRDDRYFGSATALSGGKYTFGYILRPTHAGIYEVLPTRMFDFYTPEVFGRTAGKEIRILGE